MDRGGLAGFFESVVSKLHLCVKTGGPWSGVQRAGVSSADLGRKKYYSGHISQEAVSPIMYLTFIHSRSRRVLHTVTWSQTNKPPRGGVRRCAWRERRWPVAHAMRDSHVYASSAEDGGGDSLTETASEESIVHRAHAPTGTASIPCLVLHTYPHHFMGVVSGAAGLHAINISRLLSVLAQVSTVHRVGNGVGHSSPRPHGVVCRI